MNVLHVIDSAGLYGAELVVLELMRGLTRLGHGACLASLATPRCPEKAVERAARNEGLEVIRVSALAGPDPLAVLRLLSLCRSRKIGLVHSHGYKGNILLGFVPARVRRAPLVATLHGYTHAARFGRMALYQALDRVALGRMDRVVLVHERQAEAARLGAAVRSRSVTIENGASSPPVATLDPALVEFCRRRPVIGAVGRLSKEKGHLDLVHALGGLVASGIDARLVILGEGLERRVLEDAARALGLGERLMLPGYLDAAHAYVSLFDVFVLPSLDEGLPITLIQAMQAGAAIVATDVGGVSGAAGNGEAALLVPAGDRAALARAVERLLSDSVLACGLKAHAKQRAAARFSAEAMTERYLRLYEDVLRVGGARS